MLSKCANPECFEVFRYLHEGEIFHLSPTPEVQAAAGVLSPLIHERFWLCDTCSKHMTVVWSGTHAKVVCLPLETKQEEPPLWPLSFAMSGTAPEKETIRIRLRARHAYAGRDDG